MKNINSFTNLFFALTVLALTLPGLHQLSAQSCEIPVVDPLPDLTYDPDDVVPTIPFSSNIPEANFLWTKSSQPGATYFENGIPSFTAENTSCTDAVIDTYSVQAYSGSFTLTPPPECLSAPVQFTITVNALGPNVDAGPNKIVYQGYADSSCATLQSTITGGKAPINQSWHIANGPSLGTGTSITVCPTSTTVYYLTVTDGNGCVITDSAKVCVIDVRCGNKKVTICHGTGSAKNPFQTLCTPIGTAKWHFQNHPGDQLGACGTVKACSSGSVRMADGEPANEEGIYLGAFPNPFSTSTTVRFMLPENDYVNLEMYSVDGRQIKTLFVGRTESEEIYEVTFDSAPLSNGMYLLIMNAQSGLRQTSKLILEK